MGGWGGGWMDGWMGGWEGGYAQLRDHRVFARACVCSRVRVRACPCECVQVCPRVRARTCATTMIVRWERLVGLGWVGVRVSRTDKVRDPVGRNCGIQYGYYRLSPHSYLSSSSSFSFHPPIYSHRITSRPQYRRLHTPTIIYQ